MKKNFNREEAKYIYSFLIGKFTYLRETDLHLALKRNWTYLSAYIVHGQKTHLKHEMNNKSAIQSHTRINLGLCYIWQLLCVYFVVNIITICCLVWCVPVCFCLCFCYFDIHIMSHWKLIWISHVAISLHSIRLEEFEQVQIYICFQKFAWEAVAINWFFYFYWATAYRFVRIVNRKAKLNFKKQFREEEEEEESIKRKR